MPQIHVGKPTADPELADDLAAIGCILINFHVKANNTVFRAEKLLCEKVNVADVVGAIHGGLEIFKDNVVVLVLELVIAVAVEVGDDGHATLFLRGAEGLALAAVGYDFIVGGSGGDGVAFVLGAAASAAPGSIRGTEGEEKNPNPNPNPESFMFTITVLSREVNNRNSYLLVVACSIQRSCQSVRTSELPTDQQYRPKHCGLASKLGLVRNSRANRPTAWHDAKSDYGSL